MRKFLSIISMSILLATGCSTDKENNEASSNSSEEADQNVEQNDDQKQKEKSSQEDGESGTDEKSDDDESSTEDEKKSKDEINLTDYQPEVGVTKFFKQNEKYTMTEEIIDKKDNLIQRLVSFGDMKTLQVLEWSSEKVWVIYDEDNPNQPEQSMLDKVEKVDDPITLITLKSDSGGWKILDKDSKISVPYGSFNNVIIVENVIEENDSKTTHTIFYAPGIGKVKETFEESGENGYKFETVLEEIKKRK